MRILFSKYFLLVIAFFSLCLVTLFFFRGNEDFRSTLRAEKRAITLPKEERIARWNVKKGDRVRKGDLLFEMDSFPLLQKKRRLEKELLVAKKREKLHSVELDQLSTLYILAKKDWSLGKKSSEEVDFALKNLEHAQALLDLARAEKDLIESSLEMADQELELLKVRAPCNGLVEEIFPFPEKNSIACTIYDLSHLSFVLDTKYSEKDLKESFDLMVSSFPQKTFSYDIADKKNLSHQKFRYQFQLSSEDSSLLFPDMEVFLKKKR